MCGLLQFHYLLWFLHWESLGFATLYPDERGRSPSADSFSVPPNKLPDIQPRNPSSVNHTALSILRTDRWQQGTCSPTPRVTPVTLPADAWLFQTCILRPHSCSQQTATVFRSPRPLTQQVTSKPTPETKHSEISGDLLTGQRRVTWMRE